MAEQDSRPEGLPEETPSDQTNSAQDNPGEESAGVSTSDQADPTPQEVPDAPDTPEHSESEPSPEIASASESETSPEATEPPETPELTPTPASTPDKPTPAPALDNKSASKDKEDHPFDPAVDLPAYREGMNWFVLRVASNKEKYVRETLLKKVQIEGLDVMVGRIMVPTEKTKTLKGGKARITETKLYPGYVFVEMKLEADGRIPQDVFFLIKETTGVGDFVGTAGHPTPMAPHEVEKMLFDSRRPEETPTIKMEFEKGDAVTIQEGPFENYEGTVDELLPDKGKVRVLVTIFGRQAPVELEFWQIAKAEDA